MRSLPIFTLDALFRYSFADQYFPNWVVTTINGIVNDSRSLHNYTLNTSNSLLFLSFLMYFSSIKFLCRWIWADSNCFLLKNYSIQPLNKSSLWRVFYAELAHVDVLMTAALISICDTTWHFILIMAKLWHHPKMLTPINYWKQSFQKIDLHKFSWVSMLCSNVINSTTERNAQQSSIAPRKEPLSY